jgi:hypothetical protein
LITKLETISKSTPADNTQKLTDIKTIIDELKTKGAKADLTDITAKVNAISEKADEIKTAQAKGGGEASNVTKYSAIAAAILAGLALLVAVYGVFFKPNNGNNIIRSEKSDE